MSADEASIPPGNVWNRVPWYGLAVGLLGLAGSATLAIRDPRQFYFSWLVAFMFFLSLGLGGLFFVVCHYSAKAAWSVAVRRLAEHAMSTLWLFLPLFIPIWIGMQELFPWRRPEAVQDHLMAGFKGQWLSAEFFTVRALIYFTIWIALSAWLISGSRAQDETGDHAISYRLQFWSPPMIPVFALTITAASVDWIMSLDPHWYSTIFGVYYFAGSVIGIYALMAVIATAMRGARLLRGIITPEHFHDLGKLLFAFTVFWAYIAFSQFFLIWYANIPEETLWYVHRLEGPWKPLSIFLCVGHFAIPFFFLMSRTIKRRPRLLLAGALWMLLMHFVDIYWLVMPNLHHEGPRFGLADVAALLGIGGLFLAAYGWSMRRAALVPLRDPRLPESLSFENI